MKHTKLRNLALVFILALFLGFVLAACIPSPGGDMGIMSQPPIPSKTTDVEEIDWYSGGVAISATTYFYGATENGTQGHNILRWNEAEIFATIDLVTGTNTITMTPQVSADGTNWVDLIYTVEGYAGAGVTDTQTYKTTDVTRQMVGTADGSDMIQVPLYGKYMRLKTTFLTTTYQFIPAFKIILKNH